MKVYVIEKGYYSDRHIIGIVESKEEAEYICNEFKRGNYTFGDKSIAWCEYDTKQLETKMFRFEVYHEIDGTWKAELDDYDIYDYITENQKVDNIFDYIIYAKTPQQAIKIAQDMYATENNPKLKEVL